MTDHFVIKDGKLIEYCGPEEIEELVIPEGVIQLDNYSIRRVKYCVKSVIMSESLTQIRDAAFREFTNLEKVVLSPNLTVIPEACFCECKKLSEITNTEGLTEIGSRAFEATKLQKISLPNIEKMGVSVFKYCFDLETVELSCKLKMIHYCCFGYCKSLKDLKLREGLERIGEKAFLGTPIPELEIPSSVYEIVIPSETFAPETSVTINKFNPYYRMVEGKIQKRPYHQEGGLYTVAPEFDIARRGKVVSDSSGNTVYNLRKIRYSQKKMDEFLKICNEYCFDVLEWTVKGNDDLNLEETVSRREYTEAITLDNAVISDNRVFGFLCTGRLLRIDNPVASVYEESYRSLSYYQYESCKQKYTLAKVRKD